MGSRAETRPSRVGFAGKIILRVGFAGGAVAAVGAAIDCGGGDNKAPTPDDIKSPTATVLRTESPMPSATALATQVIESPTPTAISTAKPPEPTPTDIPTQTEAFVPTPESTKTIDCGVLSGEQCLSAEAYSYSVPGGQEFYVAFRLARDVPIFSPFDGEIFAAFVPPSLPACFPKGASLMQIRTQDGGSAVALMGSIESKVNKGDVIRKGQVIAVSTQTLPGSPNDYTIAIWFLEKDAGGGMTRSEKLFRTFFPEISYPRK